MTEHFDLIFKDGIVVNGSGIRRVDVAVRGEQIVLLADDIPAAGAGRVIDAKGRYLLPGVIDVHVHPLYVDNMEGCSRVAAYGGSTMLIHFAYAKKGESLYDATKKLKDEGQAGSLLDFSLHSAPFDAPMQVGEIEKVMGLGVKSFKFLMAYVKLG